MSGSTAPAIVNVSRLSAIASDYNTRLRISSVNQCDAPAASAPSASHAGPFRHVAQTGGMQRPTGPGVAHSGG